MRRVVEDHDLGHTFLVYIAVHVQPRISCYHIGVIRESGIALRMARVHSRNYTAEDLVELDVMKKRMAHLGWT